MGYMLLRLIVIFILIVGISTIVSTFKSYRRISEEMNKPRQSNNYSRNPNNKEDIEVDYKVTNKE